MIVYENGYTKLVENPYNGEIISKAGSKDVSSSLQLEESTMSVVSKYGEKEKHQTQRISTVTMPPILKCLLS